MTFLGIVNGFVIPVVLGVLLVGGLGGLVLGCALVVNSAPTLRFIARMNTWVSTKKAFAALDRRVDVDPAPGSYRGRAILGIVLLATGLAGLYLLVTRLSLAHLARASAATIIALEAIKWILVAGSAFTTLVGALMVLMPQRWLALEQRLNAWHSTDDVVMAGERMHMPLEARTQAHPRAAGVLIAAASLFVVIAMSALLLARLH